MTGTGGGTGHQYPSAHTSAVPQARPHKGIEQTLTDNAEVATVLGSIPASSDTVESEGR
jgi:hypothetical protein